ncbi:MAG: hypothetical protein PHU08_03885 [Dehalococcoidales bacterium]|nr:hypothetical protein [Dehalococcoidales bacterium]
MGNEYSALLKEDAVTMYQLEPGDGCRHHWVIETPDGPSSRGVCKYCGTEKEFNNSFLRDSTYIMKKSWGGRRHLDVPQF